MPELKTIEFNTGRYYSAAGQRIAAMEINGPLNFFDLKCKQHVIFVDYDRGISGKIDMCLLTERDIMAQYDAGNYAWIPTESRSLEYELHATFIE